MLKITEQQLAALDADAQSRWHRRVKAWLKKQPGLREATDDMLDVLIREQEPIAAQYGAETERDYAKWFHLAGWTEGRFLRTPEVVDLLTDEECGTIEERLDAAIRAYANVRRDLDGVNA